jgi:sugar phosphate permease
MPGRERAKIFYGWKLVAAGCGLQFLQSMLLTQSFGAYVAVLRDSFGWSKTVLAGGSALQQVESALLGPIQGWISDRFGPRGMMRVGIVVFALGLMWLSQIETIAHFYFAFVMLAIGQSFAGFFPLTVAICNWFERYRARALALNSLGLALGGLAVPLVAWSMQSFGWRQTALASGVLILVVGLPLVSMIRRRPEDHGDVVDGIREPPASSASGEPARAVSRVDFTARQALATRAFWLISSGHAAALLLVAAVNVHAITHMRESLGYSIAQAALVMSAQTAAQIAGIVISMVIGDRFEKRLMSAACMLSHMVGVVLLAYATSVPMLLGFALLHGGAWGLRGPFMSAIRADYFGRASFGMIMGLSQVIVVLGSIAGPLLAGLLSDATGNYRLGFTVLAVLAGLGSAFFYFGRKPEPPAALIPTSADRRPPRA